MLVLYHILRSLLHPAPVLYVSSLKKKKQTHSVLSVKNIDQRRVKTPQCSDIQRGASVAEGYLQKETIH